MATNTTNSSATNGSVGTSRKKPSKRRMKKQVRRTIGGLFLASAIVVAAIPVERTEAVNTGKLDDASIDHTSTVDDAASKNTSFVRAVHYENENNSSFEKIPGQTTDADPTWQSKVQFIKIS